MPQEAGGDHSGADDVVRIAGCVDGRSSLADLADLPDEESGGDQHDQHCMDLVGKVVPPVRGERRNQGRQAQQDQFQRIPHDWIPGIDSWSQR